MSARAKLVVLDLDGTLARLDVDWASLHAIARAWARAAGVAVARPGVLSTIEALRAAGQPPAAAAASWLDALVALHEREAAARCPLNAALLEWLREQQPQAGLAVLTLNGRAAARTALARAGLAGRVAVIVARGEAPAKPAAHGLVRILESVDCTPDRALLVGDSAVDAACARSAGVPFVPVQALGVRWEGGGR